MDAEVMKWQLIQARVDMDVAILRLKHVMQVVDSSPKTIDAMVVFGQRLMADMQKAVAKNDERLGL